MREGKLSGASKRFARSTPRIPENGEWGRTAIGDGLAFPLGNIGQCEGADRPGVLEPAWFDCGGVAADIAQW
jgi:hypothetical protein